MISLSFLIIARHFIIDALFILVNFVKSTVKVITRFKSGIIR